MLAKLHELTEQKCGVAANDQPASAGAHAACLDAAARLAAAAAAAAMQGEEEEEEEEEPLTTSPKLAAGGGAASASASASAAAAAKLGLTTSGDGHYAMLGAAVEQLCVKDSK